MEVSSEGSLERAPGAMPPHPPAALATVSLPCGRSASSPSAEAQAGSTSGSVSTGERHFATMSDSSFESIDDAPGAPLGSSKRSKFSGTQALNKFVEEMARWNRLKERELKAFEEWRAVQSSPKECTMSRKGPAAMTLLKSLNMSLKPHHFVALAKLFLNEPGAAEGFLLLDGLPEACELWVHRKLNHFGDLEDEDHAIDTSAEQGE